jgi:hypothetical protein
MSWQEHQQWKVYVKWPEDAISLQRQVGGYILTPLSEILKMKAALSYYKTRLSVYEVHMISVYISLECSPMWETEKLWKYKLGFKTYVYKCKFKTVDLQMPCPGCCAVKSVSLRPLACGDCGFDSHRGHGVFVSCECCVLLGRGLYESRSLVQGTLPSVCVSLSVSRYNNPYTWND